MIGSLAMCLRYSFGLGEAADALEKAVANVLGSGLRTKDIAAPGANAIGTSGMGDAVVSELRRVLK
jgi:3-isopropylmalate dehydrogenase